MVSRAQLGRFRPERLDREWEPEMAGLTRFAIEPDGSMLLEFDLAQARLQLGAEAQIKEDETAPTALVAACHATSLALPTSPHSR